MTGREIKRDRRRAGVPVVLAGRQLYNFDAEDRDNLLHLGVTEQGEDVEINQRAAESDLLVYVNVNLVAMDGGHKSVAIGLASYNSLRHHHNSHTMVHSRSFMDHKHSALHSSAWRMGRLLAEHVKIFQIETTLNNDAFPQAVRLPHQARVGVVAAGPGDVPRRQARPRPAAGEAAAHGSSSRWAPTTPSPG